VSVLKRTNGKKTLLFSLKWGPLIKNHSLYTNKTLLTKNQGALSELCGRLLQNSPVHYCVHKRSSGGHIFTRNTV